MADAILSGDTASDSAFAPVWVLLGAVTVVAPVVGIEALEVRRRRGQSWLAWFAFAVALVLPVLYTIALISLRDGIWPSPD